ncbi:unnamed protein product [Amoebophrya sp. A25]|nr:unnamed protein product [Amoebophrya sp. A25]|eukprot:GSA25T00000781001.1
MNKDQIMQAVGRLRKIHFDQSVAFYGPPEVTNSILEECRALDQNTWMNDDSSRKIHDQSSPLVTSSDLLFWVTLNTIHAVENALLPWASQGATYCAVSGDSRRALLEEKCDLMTFYGHSTKLQLIRDLGLKDFTSQQRQAQARLEESKKLAGLLRFGIDQEDSSLRGDEGSVGKSSGSLEGSIFGRTEEKILKALAEFGCDREVARSALDDEYERELEQEEEEEQERELPPREAPASSKDLPNFRTLVEKAADVLGDFASISRPGQVFSETACSFFRDDGASLIFDALERTTKDSCLCVTEDFGTTLRRQQQASALRSSRVKGKNAGSAVLGAPVFRGMDQYLRPVNSVLVLQRNHGDLRICLSDREAGHLLTEIYSHGRRFHAKSAQRTKDGLILFTHVPNGGGVVAGDAGRDCSATNTLMAVNAAGERPTESVLSKALPPAAQAALQLFNGESKFGSEQVRQVVRNMIAYQKNEDTRCRMVEMLKAIRRMRGREHEFDRSDLDKILKSFGLETIA